MRERFFASDNAATVHPAIMQALIEANSGHGVAYGEDEWTTRANRVVQNVFGRKARAFYVYSGTGANVIGLKAALRSFEAVICTRVSHINMDECGAVENFIGSKIIPVETLDGRMSADQIPPMLSAKGVVHHSQPKVVSVTQATELGTVYHPEAIREIARVCHQNGMLLHMDGARISNAAVRLGVDLGDITNKLGVDILSLGGTKNGLMFGEVVVVWDREIAERLTFAQKQGMQLASKMRFIAAQFLTLFGSDLWRENANSANELAAELGRRLAEIPGVDVVYPVEANGVFARLPRNVVPRVQEEIFFYEWEPDEGIVRFMVSFDNTLEDIDALEAAIRRQVG